MKLVVKDFQAVLCSYLSHFQIKFEDSPNRSFFNVQFVTYYFNGYSFVFSTRSATLLMLTSVLTLIARPLLLSTRLSFTSFLLSLNLIIFLRLRVFVLRTALIKGMQQTKRSRKHTLYLPFIPFVYSGLTHCINTINNF